MSEPDRNPYAPPIAPVADIPRGGPQSRPRPLRAALWLIGAAVVAGVIHVPFVLNRRPGAFTGMSSEAKAILAGVSILLLLLVGLFIRTLYRGRNWARIVYSIFAVGLTLPFIERYWERVLRSPFDGGLEMIQLLLELSATAMLWSRPVNRWFKGHRTPSPDSTAIAHYPTAD